MDTGLLEDQHLIAKSRQPARLDGYSLRIGQRATLEKPTGKQVHGIIMSLDENDLRRLYSEPSVADYVPESVIVNLSDGNRTPVRCYILPPANCHGQNREYALALAATAKKIGLPADYVSEIETWAS